MRPVLVAPDKFKGTLAADAVASAIAKGLSAAAITADVCPLADGGEGTIDVVASAVDAEIVQGVDVVDALGRPTAARVALFDAGRTALIQVSEAIGLAQARSAFDPVAASSFGAGQLIAAAAATGARSIFVGIGGTASSDGGSGAIDALREAGLVGKRGPLKRLPKLIALCDVRSEWEQAGTVFAEQKGADAAACKAIAARLDALAGTLPRDPRGILMTGAGGGLSGGLWAAAGAELKSGAAFVLDRLGFTPRMTSARAVITGEGSLDRQTLLGKAVGEVATRARQAGVPCHAIVGRAPMSDFERRILDFESVQEATTAKAIAAAAESLTAVLAAS